MVATMSAVAGSGKGDSGNVRPTQPILAGEIEIVADPSGTSVVLAVDASIPVACAVIYGPDESFGSIAVDIDMAGAPTTNPARYRAASSPIPSTATYSRDPTPTESSTPLRS